jgi:hypothetical protein
MNSIRIGKVTGTGAAINVPIGFVPDYVRIVNATDGDRTDDWFRDGMAAGTSIPTTAQVGATLGSNGISALDSSTLGKGFTIGSTISESGKVLTYVAMRNTP